MVSLIFLTFALFANTAHSVDPIQCSEYETCQCTQDEACQMECIGTTQCKGSKGNFPDTILSCRPGYPCTITCSGSRACKYAQIYANGATSFTLECSDYESCKHTVVDCTDTDNCDIICDDNSSGSGKTCEQMDLYCDTSICSIDCETQNTCKSISINTDDASAFECINICPDTVPSSFIRNIASTTHSVTRNTYSLSSTEAFESTITHSSSTHTSTLISHVSTATDDQVSTEQHKQQEQEVKEVAMDTTYINDIQSKDDTQRNMMGIDDIWIYIGVGGAVFCCSLIGLIYAVGHRKKEAFKEEPHVAKHHPVPKPIQLHVPSTTGTVATTPSVSSPIAWTPATMTPVTPVKIRNLGVIRDGTQYTNPFPDTVNTGFSMYLANEILSGSMAMDDIVNGMVSTPGQFDVDLSVNDNMGMELAIEMNPMKEGTYLNDIPLLNDGEDDDEILDDINKTANEMELNEGQTGDETGDEKIDIETDDIDVDEIIITDFGRNNEDDDVTIQ